MRNGRFILLAGCAALLGACGQANDNAADTDDAAPAEAEAMAVNTEPFEITAGLTATITQPGNGDEAAAGQTAVVHYTGWLYDPAVEGGRGPKFDSSVDRGEHFRFPLGQGRVISGWDQGVVGMKVGEKRELIIAPQMAYGDRAIGDLIPPGSTLLFEVELAGLE